MKKISSLLLSLLFAITSYCQTDTIFSNNQKIPCSIKEITPDAIKFTYPSEDLVNSIYKNSVQKIIFKSGRVQTFSEATSYKEVKSPSDYDNVTITQVEGEVKGLFKLGEVSSKAKGTTTLSNQERVKERAYRKLKLQAAIMGGNIIYLTNMRTEGNKMGSYYQSSSSAETSLSGVCYTNQLPSFDDFKKLTNGIKKFIAVKESKLYSSSSDISEKSVQYEFIVNNILNENGIIIINGTLDGDEDYTKFRVVSFNQSGFNIFYETKNTVYNIQISF